MKTQTIIVALVAQILALLQCARAQAKPAGDPVPYRLLAGSSLLTETTTTPEAPVESSTGTLTGTFTLTKQLSPLDFDVYQLDDIRWLSVDDRGPKRIEGTGTYTLSSRFGNTKQITLKLQMGDTRMDLASDSVPNDENWPIIDIIARGSAQRGEGKVDYTLHLIATPELQVWHYRLFEGSYFMNDCPICDRIPIQEPMRGDFDLVLIEENTLNSRFLVRDLHFTTSWDGLNRTITGKGTFQIGGEVAILQAMTLELTVESPETKEFKIFTNSNAGLTKFWPIIDISLDETEGTISRIYRLRLNAAPLREIWFSIGSGFTAGNPDLPDRSIGTADVLSDLGRVVTPGSDLFAAIGVDPSGKPGLDAITILPGGEEAFSLSTDVKGQTLGPIQHGDLLSDQGRIIHRNDELLAPFGPMPGTADVGLDGVQVLDTGEILFSLKTDVFSERQSITLHDGDLLSSQGGVRKTYQQLISSFRPSSGVNDYGLDAFYVWPNGEVWFSTTKGFNDIDLGPISDGDLISDKGYIVFRNLELLSAFAPLEKPTNFGFDGLYVVTDVSIEPTAPKLSAPVVDSLRNSVSLSWSGKGRVFQALQTTDLGFPFGLASPIVPGSSWTGPGSSSLGFYRLRQW